MAPTSLDVAEAAAVAGAVAASGAGAGAGVPNDEKFEVGAAGAAIGGNENPVRSVQRAFVR